MRYTNGQADPAGEVLLTGVLEAGATHTLCKSKNGFTGAYGFMCDQRVKMKGKLNPAHSNGDDNIVLLNPSGEVVDVFGVPGEDGTNTDHDFKDGRAVRLSSVVAGNAVWTPSEWQIDSKTLGEGMQYAPEDFDPGIWVGAGLP